MPGVHKKMPGTQKAAPLILGVMSVHMNLNSSKITPEKITNPIQLIAAWFVMLILLVGLLLGAAIKITEPSWVTGYLVISVSILILIVVVFVFLMLTKYRPHLQDSEKYAIWLKDKNKYVETNQPSETPNITKIPELEPTVGNTPQEQIEFIKKARSCNVEVINTDNADLLLKSLLKVGFSASMYNSTYFKDGFKISNATGVWIGSNLEPEAVLTAIEIAVTHWPQLKYLFLSSDGGGPEYTHDQLFIGGDESVAKNKGLNEWTIAEIQSIPKNITLENFHKCIRNKYS